VRHVYSPHGSGTVSVYGLVPVRFLEPRRIVVIFVEDRVELARVDDVLVTWARRKVLLPRRCNEIVDQDHN
jgi:hypothetical protein